MEYKVLVAHSPNDLTEKVNAYLQQGWEIVGSHQVAIRHEQNRFRGTQHMDTLNDLEYTQTIIKKNQDEQN